nr:MAG TPA: Scaffold protein Ste5, Fus3-binding region [Caudoviricetes sp.]
MKIIFVKSIVIYLILGNLRLLRLERKTIYSQKMI